MPDENYAEDDKTVLRVLDYRLKTLQENQTKSEESTRRDFDALRQTTSRIEDAVQMLKAEQWGKSLERLEKSDEEKEKRIRALEQWRYWMMGGLAILGVLFVYIMKKIP
jgi:hypothetical protein